MPVLRAEETIAEQLRDGLSRKMIVNNTLMTVVVDFTDGPWEQPEPPHSHPHEQTCYVAEGELIFICEGEEDQHLKKGDMFSVLPDKKHTVQLLTRFVRLVDNFTPLRQDFLK
ncbi:MAG: cupin domain-containing protein [Chitinophagaceae bacterium]